MLLLHQATSPAAEGYQIGETGADIEAREFRAVRQGECVLESPHEGLADIQRRMEQLTKAKFTRNRLKSMIDSVQNLINNTCDSWMAEGRPDQNGHVQVNMFLSMLNLAAHVSVRHGAGVHPENIKIYAQLYLVALKIRNVMKSTDVLVSAYLPRWMSNVWFMLGMFFGRSYKLVTKHTEQKYQLAMSKLLEDPSTLNPDSLLSWIHGTVPNDEAQRQVYHFFLETHLLLAGIAAFALAFLGWKVDVQTKLRQEINNVLKFRPDVTLEDLARMKYLDIVIEETQRYASVTRIIDRECTREVELRGHDGQKCVLQPGYLVFASLSTLNQDEQVWSRASEVTLSKFPKSSDLLIPFPGLSSSVAAPFNMMLLKLLLVTAVRKFKIGDGTRSDFHVHEDMFFRQACYRSKVRPAKRNNRRN